MFLTSTRSNSLPVSQLKSGREQRRMRYRAVPFFSDGKPRPAISCAIFSRSFSTKLRGASDGRSASPLQPQRATGITILAGGRTRYARSRRVRIPIAFNPLILPLKTLNNSRRNWHLQPALQPRFRRSRSSRSTREKAASRDARHRSFWPVRIYLCGSLSTSAHQR